MNKCSSNIKLFFIFVSHVKWICYIHKFEIFNEINVGDNFFASEMKPCYALPFLGVVYTIMVQMRVHDNN
jgi:hypothetical protein